MFNEKATKVNKPFYKRWWMSVLAILIIGVIASGCADTTVEETEELLKEGEEARKQLKEARETREAVEDLNQQVEILTGEDADGDGEVATAEPVEEVKKEEPAPATPAIENPITKMDKDAYIVEVTKQAEADHPDDYRTQDYVIESQTQAFDDMVKVVLNSDAELRVLNNALSDHPNDMRTVQYVFGSQLEAMNN